ncbi:hypothetical protein GCM10020216_020700 [Nonomuraea helvata]
MLWGIDANITTTSLKAIVSTLNRALSIRGCGRVVGVRLLFAGSAVVELAVAFLGDAHEFDHVLDRIPALGDLG